MPDGGAGAADFGERAEAWSSWQASPWGRLRYDVVRHTTALAMADLTGPLRVLDIGGGDGGDSLPLAVEGHEITILDIAPALLERAEQAAEAAGVAGRVRTVCADLDGILGNEGDMPRPAGSDVVLCHNLLQYRADVPATVEILSRLVRVGGMVSVMAPNPAMDVLAAAVRRLDPRAAGQVLDSPTVHGETFDRDMRRLEPAAVEEALRDAGCAVGHRFGIRCLMDLIADDDRKADPDFYAGLLELELRLCEREPYWRTARFWQLTARRMR